MAYGYEKYFQNAVNQLKERLTIPTGDPEHDKSETFKEEKALLNWLNHMSIAKLFDWFDAVQETTVDLKIGKVRWSTESVKRERLFLRMLGIPEL